MKRNGRPPKSINQKQFENLCAIQCTIEEICAVLDVSDKTLYKWVKETYDETFSAVFAKKRQLGKASLRRTQWKLAETSTPMAIFLGKNMLGQADDPNRKAFEERRLAIEEKKAGIGEQVEDANEQYVAIADLINAPVEERKLDDVMQSD